MNCGISRWEASSPHVARDRVLRPFIPAGCHHAHGPVTFFASPGSIPKEQRREDPDCRSCLVHPLCPVLATGPFGIGSVANSMAARPAVSPGWDHLLCYVRALAGPPVSTCPPPRLAAQARNGGLTTRSTGCCFAAPV